jgi:hypothetical protein
MSDLVYAEISQPASLKENASSVLSGSLIPSTVRKIRVLNPKIKEWKICEFCGLSFYRTEGSKRKYCSRESCTEALLCVRDSGPGHGVGRRVRRAGQ